MPVSYAKAKEVINACRQVATEVTLLHSRIVRFLADNTSEAITWTPATKVFTVANATDICTSTAHGQLNGQKARVTNSGGALPAPLLADTDYWLIAVAANTFQLAATKGGAAINLTTDGTGTQTLNPVPEYLDEDDATEAGATGGAGNLSGYTFSRQQVANAIGSLDEIRKLLLNIAPAQGDHLGNLNQLVPPLG